MNDFMLTWMKWILVCSFAMGPLGTYLGLLRMISGTADREDDPLGCVIVGLLLFLAAPFIGWWVYVNFNVVWRP
jgi:accessory gene regulator protein AgrB